jgi:hypothetical protein
VTPAVFSASKEKREKYARVCGVGTPARLHAAY